MEAPAEEDEVPPAGGGAPRSGSAGGEAEFMPDYMHDYMYDGDVSRARQVFDFIDLPITLQRCVAALTARIPDGSCPVVIRDSPVFDNAYTEHPVQESLRQLVRQRELQIVRCRVTDAVMRVHLSRGLSSMPSLTALSLRGNALTEAGVQQLAQALSASSNPPLRCLGLQYNWLGPVAPLALCRLLGQREVRCACDAYLGAVSHTHCLWLCQTCWSGNPENAHRATVSVVRDGQNAEARCPVCSDVLGYVDADSRNRGGSKAMFLCARCRSEGECSLDLISLPRCSLAELRLSGNTLCNTGAAALAGVLIGDSAGALRYLELRNCQIGAAGSKVLVSIAREYGREIDLSENPLGDDGSRQLFQEHTAAPPPPRAGKAERSGFLWARGLDVATAAGELCYRAGLGIQNRCITHLDLSGTPLCSPGDAGGAAAVQPLLDALKKGTPCLRVLELRRCGLSGPSLGRFAISLLPAEQGGQRTEWQSGLRHVDLSFNRTIDSEAHWWCTVIIKNLGLEHLGLSGVGWGPQSLQQLRRAAADRCSYQAQQEAAGGGGGAAPERPPRGCSAAAARTLSRCRSLPFHLELEEPPEKEEERMAREGTSGVGSLTGTWHVKAFNCQGKPAIRYEMDLLQDEMDSSVRGVFQGKHLYPVQTVEPEAHPRGSPLAPSSRDSWCFGTTLRMSWDSRRHSVLRLSHREVPRPDDPALRLGYHCLAGWQWNQYDDSEGDIVAVVVPPEDPDQFARTVLAKFEQALADRGLKPREAPPPPPPPPPPAPLHTGGGTLHGGIPLAPGDPGSLPDRQGWGSAWQQPANG